MAFCFNEIPQIITYTLGNEHQRYIRFESHCAFLFYFFVILFNTNPSLPFSWIRVTQVGHSCANQLTLGPFGRCTAW